MGCILAIAVYAAIEPRLGEAGAKCCFRLNFEHQARRWGLAKCMAQLADGL